MCSAANRLKLQCQITDERTALNTLTFVNPLYSFMHGAWNKISVRLILKVHNGQDEIWRSEAAQ